MPTAASGPPTRHSPANCPTLTVFGIAGRNTGHRGRLACHHYTYTPSTTCNGCTGTLVDDDGTVVVPGLSKEALELAHYRISVAAAEEGITSIFDPGWFNV